MSLAAKLVVVACVETVALFGLLIRASPHRTDRNDETDPWSLGNNVRVLLPSCYDKKGKRFLILAWPIYLALLATIFYLIKTLSNAAD